MKLNPNHIPSIYNYCDRWCERCAFTQRCAVYEKPNELSPEEMDINNEKFWQKISDSFTEAIKMLYEKAAEHGIDLDAVIAEDKEDYKKKRDEELIQVEAHPLIKLTKQYTNKAKKLYELVNTENKTLQELETELNLGIKDESKAKTEADDYIDCLDIINWYLFQIQIKCMRAVTGTMRNSIDFDEDDEDLVDDDGRPYIKDSDGSAKVALIGADRSLIAWRKIMDRLPDHESEIIDVLVLLQKIIRLGEETFPNARGVVRPGLDE